MLQKVRKTGVQVSAGSTLRATRTEVWSVDNNIGYGNTGCSLAPHQNKLIKSQSVAVLRGQGHHLASRVRALAPDFDDPLARAAALLLAPVLQCERSDADRVASSRAAAIWYGASAARCRWRSTSQSK